MAGEKIMFILYLSLLVLMAVAAGIGSELIVARTRGLTPARADFWKARSLYARVAFIGIGTLGLITVLFWDVKALLGMTAFRFLCGSLVLLFLFGMATLYGVGHRACKWGTMALCFLLLTMLLEGVFNFRSIQSYEFKTVDLTEYMVSSEGAQEVLLVEEDKTQVLPSGQTQPSVVFVDCMPTEPGTYRLKNKKLVMEFDFSGSELELENLHLDIYAPGSKGAGENIKVATKLTDEGNENYYWLSDRQIVNMDNSTKWIALDTAGESNRLYLQLEISGSELQINRIEANSPKQFRISVIRMLIVFLLSFALYAVRPGSPLYRYKMNGSHRQITVVFVVIILNIILAFSVISCGSKFLDNISEHHDQYQKLAEQLAKGEVTYPGEIPDFIEELENPYDTTARKEALRENGYSDMWGWDRAYFEDPETGEGAFYVYFGITPVILMYLPFYLITGKSALPNDIAVFIAAAAFIAGVFMLLYRLMKRKSPNMPFLGYLLLSLLVANGSGLFNLLIYPSLYTVPISVGMALTVWGLTLWLGALEKPTLSWWQLLLGSLCMALVAGCRPQMLLWSFVAIPLFYTSVVKDRTLLPTSKNGVQKLVCFVLPYVVVAAGLMYYNAIRFGSPFDFGANYNLTTNDMTVRGFQMGRIGSALYAYLLQMPKYTSLYPFIRFSDFDSTYMGTVVRENTFGGLFAISPFALLGLAAFGFRKWLKEHKLFAMTLFLLLCGLVIAIMDAQMAGILQRYFSDFSMFFILAAVLVFVVLYQKLGQTGKKCLMAFLIVTMLCSFFHSMTLVFYCKMSTSSLVMPVWLKSAFQFWM